jgi:hypothetical protein
MARCDWVVLATCLGIAALLPACGGGDDGNQDVADVDAEADRGAEADEAAEATPDGEPDGEPDVEPDAAPDAEPDVAPDAAPDAEPETAPDGGDEGLHEGEGGHEGGMEGHEGEGGHEGGMEGGDRFESGHEDHFESGHETWTDVAPDVAADGGFSCEHTPRKCDTSADCLLYSDYTSPDCCTCDPYNVRCIPVEVPTCECFIDPCVGHAVDCVGGECVVIEP